MNGEERQRLVNNIAGHLINAQKFLQERAIKNFGQADPEFGGGIRKAIERLEKSSSPPLNIVAAAASSNAKL